MPVSGRMKLLLVELRHIFTRKYRHLFDRCRLVNDDMKFVKEAARFGITEEFAANYNADSVGTAVIYEAVCDAVCSVRASKPMSAKWKQKVDEDYLKRGK